MNLRKAFQILSSLFILILISCSEEETPAVNASLSFVLSSIPTSALSYQGSSFEIEVNWAYNEWNIKSGDALEGVQFISALSPSRSGAVDGENTQTSVTVYYNTNRTYTVNRQQIILSSLTDDISDTIVVTQEAKPVPSVSVSIDPDLTYQKISGFGGANMIWGTDYLTSSEMDLAFGSGDSGLGLSLYRVRLSSNKDDWAGLVSSVKGANDRGVTVMASPWSPPAEWKSNSSTNGGGYLLKEHYGDFAAYINEFIQFMDGQGAKIDVVSIQNEPDWAASYEGCEYTKEEMLNFIKNYAGTIQGAKVLAAESLNSDQSYTDNILNDAEAAENLDIVGGHLYGSGLAPYSLAAQKGKELWMTEHLLNLDSGNNPGNWTADTDPATIWEETMEMVTEIQTAMEYNWNAYIWWYIRRYYSFLGDGEKGTSRGEILKRGYAFSQFSNYIRPGYVRIDAQLEDASAGTTVTAYKGENEIVLILVNSSDTETSTIDLTLPSGYTTATLYTTSLNENRTEEQLAVTNSTVEFTLGTSCVETVVFSN